MIPSAAREQVDLAIVGAGAAGLMAAIQAGRRAPGRRILALDGARSLGAKILVAGGGRCNVTHFEVEAADFAGSSRNAIAKVLRELPVPETIGLLPRDRRRAQARADRQALPGDRPGAHRARRAARAAREAGVKLLYPRRVTCDRRARQQGFRLSGDWGEVAGPESDPRRRRPGAAEERFGRRRLRSGARPRAHHDGDHLSLRWCRSSCRRTHWLRTVQGIAVPARIEVRAGNWQAPLRLFRGDLLCTHFGLSGPVVLDASRHFLAARQADPAGALRGRLPARRNSRESHSRSSPTSAAAASAAGWRRSSPTGSPTPCCASAGLDPAANALRLKTRGAPGAPAGAPRARDPDHRRPRLRPRRGDRRRHPARPGPARDDGVAALPAVSTSAARSSTSTAASAASTFSGPGRAERWRAAPRPRLSPPARPRRFCHHEARHETCKNPTA